ncbi:MAG: YdjY domain-containing protein [Planctomycetota bacterium]
MRNPRTRFCAVLVAVSAAAAGAAEPTTRPTTDGAATVRFRHIRIDREEGQVVLDARVVLREGLLELLVCREDTKEHESILATPAKAAHLHAGLLSLGLTPGRAAHWTDAGAEARFVPPRGPELKILLRWTDEDGTTRRVDATDWIQPTGESDKPLNKWVFVGSRVLPDGRYWADVDGDVVSVANFASAVVDVPFESTAENVALEFQARTAAIPPLGTPVEVIVQPLPGAADSPYARKLLEIDRFGAMRIDGRAIRRDQIEPWARRYTRKHPKGFVRIRASGRARVADVDHAISELRLGGLRDYEVERLRPPLSLLPRTEAQLKRALASWEAKLAEPDELLEDPFEQADAVLDEIAAERCHLDRRRKLLDSYARHLRELLDKHAPDDEAP